MANIHTNRVDVGDVVSDWDGAERIGVVVASHGVTLRLTLEEARALLSGLSASLFDHSIREATDEGRVAEAEALMERLTEPF